MHFAALAFLQLEHVCGISARDVALWLKSHDVSKNSKNDIATLGANKINGVTLLGQTERMCEGMQLAVDSSANEASASALVEHLTDFEARVRSEPRKIASENSERSS